MWGYPKHKLLIGWIHPSSTERQMSFNQPAPNEINKTIFGYVRESQRKFLRQLAIPIALIKIIISYYFTGDYFKYKSGGAITQYQ